MIYSLFEKEIYSTLYLFSSQANVSSALKTTKPSDTDEYKPRRIQQVETKTPVETITKQESSEVKEEEKMDVDNVVPGPSSAPESSASAPKEAKPKVPKKERKITKEEIEKLESETIPVGFILNFVLAFF